MTQPIYERLRDEDQALTVPFALEAATITEALAEALAAFVADEAIYLKTGRIVPRPGQWAKARAALKLAGVA